MRPGEKSSLIIKGLRHMVIKGRLLPLQSEQYYLDELQKIGFEGALAEGKVSIPGVSKKKSRTSKQDYIKYIKQRKYDQ